MIFFLLIFFYIFPYFSLLPLNFDTQPYGWLLSILIIVCYRKIPIKKTVLLLSVPIPIVLLLSAMAFDNIFLSLRGLITYTYPFIIMVLFSLMDHKEINYKKFIPIFFYIYFFGALAQFIFWPEILSPFVEVRTTELRGLTSFTPEPSIFGYFLLFFLIIFDSQKEFNKRYFLKFLCVFGIIFFSQSSVAIAILIGYLILRAVLSISLKRVPLFIAGSFIVFFNIGYLFEYFEGSRLYNLTNLLISEPRLLLLDNSISDRLSDVFISLYGSFLNFFIPYGFNNYYEINNLLVDQNQWINDFFIGGGARTIDGKIKSGIGAGFFELGLFFFFYLFVIVKSILFSSLAFKRKIPSLFVVVGCSLMSLPISASIIWVYLALLRSK